MIDRQHNKIVIECDSCRKKKKPAEPEGPAAVTALRVAELRSCHET